MSRFTKGVLAEFCVRGFYEDQGYECIETRKRLGRTEIDLIFQKGPMTVFVEVKAAKTHDDALMRIHHAQTSRLFQAAELYLGAGQDHFRIDVAAVNEQGQVLCLENAFAGA